MHTPSTIQELLSLAGKEHLFKNILIQLNKDFLRAGTNIQLPFTETPQHIVNQLQEILYKLIDEDFTTYLNLLYAVDVSEKEVAQIDTSNTEEMIQKITYLILVREWQKIIFKNYKF